MFRQGSLGKVERLPAQLAAGDAMLVEVEDRAAVVYDVEFLRAYVSGRSVAVAHRVACNFVAQRSVACASVPLAMEYPAMAGAAFLLPGLVNGYGKIVQDLRLQAEVLRAIEGRLEMVEQKLDRLCG